MQDDDTKRYSAYALVRPEKGVHAGLLVGAPDADTSLVMSEVGSSSSRYGSGVMARKLGPISKLHAKRIETLPVEH